MFNNNPACRGRRGFNLTVRNTNAQRSSSNPARLVPQGQLHLQVSDEGLNSPAHFHVTDLFVICHSSISTPDIWRLYFCRSWGFQNERPVMMNVSRVCYGVLHDTTYGAAPSPPPVYRTSIRFAPLQVRTDDPPELIWLRQRAVHPVRDTFIRQTISSLQ